MQALEIDLGEQLDGLALRHGDGLTEDVGGLTVGIARQHAQALAVPLVARDEEEMVLVRIVVAD